LPRQDAQPSTPPHPDFDFLRPTHALCPPASHSSPSAHTHTHTHARLLKIRRQPLVVASAAAPGVFSVSPSFRSARSCPAPARSHPSPARLAARPRRALLEALPLLYDSVAGLLLSPRSPPALGSSTTTAHAHKFLSTTRAENFSLPIAHPQTARPPRPDKRLFPLRTTTTNHTYCRHAPQRCLCISTTTSPSPDTHPRSSCIRFAYRGNVVVLNSTLTAEIC